ncbi:5-formyltetrahydrofolate cyclo-ligase [Streptomyces clavuligerus]|uniref:5-formyltetrahydrofolate cyclo-ligase n=1 Tax=Streptomyces clavuligerus TaxID=1901 RepID=E2Q7I7_STRCL|nr:5-formyltetrahydrofolate cyclo-ligase [Streptomyces clavuligerus]EFG07393.1 ligase [Streptomyces clavuligerus]MBY6304379.1 5-formyltetrahydrofolate cyclo-ligase [Streptomyces clavuligerus]QPL64399.1 5-formyltetrahydrofolate cyclo-ligase [Streptomyces clavuligerus]QPL70427.1 5-formyltetrahydrofolate cyclo-ligase [Streptomyces clavuligerus]QPL76511.1 5-formyltetrahydrofolate cyclo-ligase [Streptomyces clavuligerus]
MRGTAKTPEASGESGGGAPGRTPGGAPGGAPDTAAHRAPDKRAVRGGLLAARRLLPPEAVALAAASLARHALDLPELGRADTVAAYVSVGTEPGTRDLLDALRARGTRVLLPVLLPDNDLDWGEYRGPGRLARAGRGLLEPDGPRLGPDAVLAADAVLVPGLAVDRRGLRLGRGGGSYDRVLTRLERSGARPALVVLLYADEVVAEVPAEPHDRPVHAAVTPEGVHRFRAPDVP